VTKEHKGQASWCGCERQGSGDNVYIQLGLQAKRINIRKSGIGTEPAKLAAKEKCRCHDVRIINQKNGFRVMSTKVVKNKRTTSNRAWILTDQLAN